MSKYVRISSHSLRFANEGKLRVIHDLVKQYRTMVKKYVNILWGEFKANPPKMLDSYVCNRIKTNVNFDSRLRQCAAKQACSMVNSVLKKRNARLFKLKELQKKGESFKHLQRLVDVKRISKPDVSRINLELDQRFVDIQDANGAFDLFVNISSIGDKRELNLPVKHTKVSRKWEKAGDRKLSIRLNEKNLCFIYEVEKNPKYEGETVGADQGQKTCLSLSDGQVTTTDQHGHDLTSITKALCRRRKGSKGFRKAQAQRKQYINWSLNQLDFGNIKELKLEKVLDIRKGKRTSRYSSHWSYPDIKRKLVALGEVEGFHLTEVDNRFRSQRCSKCGWVHKGNRKGKTFRCSNGSCGHTADADLNAASNLKLCLADVSHSPVWFDRMNRTAGFYWLVDGFCDQHGELIVPHIPK